MDALIVAVITALLLWDGEAALQVSSDFLRLFKTLTSSPLQISHILLHLKKLSRITFLVRLTARCSPLRTIGPRNKSTHLQARRMLQSYLSIPTLEKGISLSMEM